MDESVSDARRLLEATVLMIGVLMACLACFALPMLYFFAKDWLCSWLDGLFNLELDDPQPKIERGLSHEQSGNHQRNPDGDEETNG